MCAARLQGQRRRDRGEWPQDRARVMSRLGWYESDGIVAFAMPDQVFGEAKTKIIYQNAATSNPYRVKGTVAEWSKQVGSLCVSNSRLTLAASAAFAAPLLYITGDEG